jgi:hypothetical protein
MLAHGHKLLGDEVQAKGYRTRFHALVEEFSYWKRRVEEFPELLEYAE